MTGCSDESHCGVFSRVPASCASGNFCPGGRWANGNTDPTRCDGVPTYQAGGPGGPVLYRFYYSGSTYWRVGPSGRLNDCNPSGDDYCSLDHDYCSLDYLGSDLNPGRPDGAPTAHGYSAEDGWTDFDNNFARGAITVTAGDGSASGGGGGH